MATRCKYNHDVRINKLNQAFWISDDWAYYAFTQGRQACIDGRSVSTNLFVEGSRNSWYWTLGYRAESHDGIVVAGGYTA